MSREWEFVVCLKDEHFKFLVNTPFTVPFPLSSISVCFFGVGAGFEAGNRYSSLKRVPEVDGLGGEVF